MYSSEPRNKVNFAHKALYSKIILFGNVTVLISQSRVFRDLNLKHKGSRCKLPHTNKYFMIRILKIGVRVEVSF